MQDHWFIFQNNQILLMKDEATGKLPTDSSLSELKPHFLKHYYLGIFNQLDCSCAEIPTEMLLPHIFEPVSVRKGFEALGKDWYTALAKAYAVINWDTNHHYCGRCGSATVLKEKSFERVCPQCDFVTYPRISPSMIVLIKKGDHILMARSPHFPPGAYALIAGFVELGESIEEAVHREVKEEVGITIKNLCYFGSQSWPFPDSLMIGFTADYAAGEIQIDHHEIEDAGWYRYDALPGRPSTSISIAARLIDTFVSEQKKK